MIDWESRVTPAQDYDDQGRAVVDVAFAFGEDRRVRLSIWAPNGEDYLMREWDHAVLLTPERARQVAHFLTEAADAAESGHY